MLMYDNNLNSIDNSLRQFEQSAVRISKAAVDPNVSLEKEIVDSIQNEHNIAANAKMIKVTEEAEKTLLDILG